MSSPVVLVTGATGAVGPPVAQALHSAGYVVRNLSRNAPEAGLLPSDTEIFTGSITDEAAVSAAMEGVEVVVHMAALLHDLQAKQTEQSYRQTNVAGAANIFRIAERAGVRRVILFSTISVYGNSNGEILREESAAHPKTLYAQTKVEAERMLLSSRNTYGQPLGAVLRLGAVYGPRMKGNYLRMVRLLAHHRFVPVGNGQNRRTLIYDRDVAAAIVLAAAHPAAAGRIYNLTDGQFHSMHDLVGIICRALGREPPHWGLPLAPARWAIGAGETLARLVGVRPLIDRATVNTFTEDLAVSGTLLQRELGFIPRFDLESGWTETIREMRRTKTL